ncbi:Cytochrome b-c1 complex subunit Rieske, mitochondrial [Hondaea fermentalgiana]|uniref:Cytochrome b-c1 complex subunit Rieske, mitochondrial n=1 Tax=Hondaea fermentalgiana TaxID=2315210 RepID=A0A2R5G4D0_9STRA|nr:Cytochrome b-c1 complex subunit Rieske, mitochondrial [Hondaea fermentalgiana]|eukprot:GBG25169.1 Cytochrome b-c1 complex subunit Rieske, mitochondrial [Hondaea fermentalgiana]
MMSLRAGSVARVAALRNVAAGQMRMSSTKVVDDLGSTDKNFENAVPKSGDADRREFTYLALGGARFMYASAVRLALIKFVSTMSASADVMALASLEVELGKIPEGSSTVVKWRGKPVFIRNRTAAEIKEAESVNISELRDPESDADRVIDPKWLVTLGICTHLGCVPISNAGDYHGWFCPCHGSHYDVSGRIRKGPAPLNLEVPPYKFIEDGAKVLVG